MPSPNAPWRARARLAALVLSAVCILAGCGTSKPELVGHRAAEPARATAPSTSATTTPKPATSTAPVTTAPATTAAAAATTTAPVPAPTEPPAAARAPVWAGKGMWIWQPEQAEGGDGAAIVNRAVAEGITTLFVRTGSSHDGLTIDWAMALLPIAHAAGVRVVGWDFPELDNIELDIIRAMSAVRATAADGSHLDGFAADIETRAEGTNLTAQNAFDYGTVLRASLPPIPLIACVPNPSAHYREFFPYPEAISGFDAIAPMVYWLDRDPASDVAQAVDYFAGYQKPVAPVGQAFDGGPEGGRPGQPTSYELSIFAQTALDHGASGLSFWSWQHADDDTFANIGSLPEIGIG
jgi:hypothetical protein